MAGANDIRRVAIVGGGVIGGGWAARCLAHGLDVVASDPGPGAEEKLRATVANAWPALTTVGLKPGASQQRLSFAKDLESAVKDADFVQESAPENEDLKRKLHARIDAAARPHVIIASSSSGLLPSPIPGRLQASRARAGRPSLQPGLYAAAGGSAGRRQDRREVHRPGGGFLSPHFHAPAEGEGGGAGLYRRPAAGGAVARGAASDRRRGLHHRPISTMRSASARACAGPSSAPA